MSVWITETVGLISQCVRLPGVVAQLTIGDLQRACISRGCQTLYQLQGMVRLVPSREIKIRVEMLVNRLDRAGLDVMGEPWPIPSPGKLLIAEAVWPALRSIAIDRGNSP